MNGKENPFMNILYLLHPKNTVEFLCDFDTFEKGYNCLRSSSYTAIPVIDSYGLYIGTISEGDFLAAIMDNHLFSPEAREDYTVADFIIKGKNPPVRVNANIDELLVEVMDRNFLPIVDDRGIFVGIITRKDIIGFFCRKYTGKGEDAV